MAAKKPRRMVMSKSKLLHRDSGERLRVSNSPLLHRRQGEIINNRDNSYWKNREKDKKIRSYNQRTEIGNRLKNINDGSRMSFVFSFAFLVGFLALIIFSIVVFTGSANNAFWKILLYPGKIFSVPIIFIASSFFKFLNIPDGLPLAIVNLAVVISNFIVYTIIALIVGSKLFKR